ncbi:hypothetical protein M9458_007826, partial [Cirrhinus mrigala]
TQAQRVFSVSARVSPWLMPVAQSVQKAATMPLRRRAVSVESRAASTHHALFGHVAHAS